MTQIIVPTRLKNARMSNEQIVRQLAAEILVTARHLRGGTTAQKLSAAKRIVRDLWNTKGNDLNRFSATTNDLLLRQAEEIIDSPTRSVTNAPVNENAKNIPGPTYQTQSKYQTKAQMIKALVDQGLSLQEATAAAEEVFGPGNTPRAGVTTFTRNISDYSGGGKSKVTTYTPSKGTFNSRREAFAGTAIKQASNSIPGFVYAITGGNPPDLISSETTRLRGAALEQHKAKMETICNTSIAEMLIQKDEARRSRILSARAKETEQYPGWMRSLAIFDQYTGVQR